MALDSCVSFLVQQSWSAFREQNRVGCVHRFSVGPCPFRHCVRPTAENAALAIEVGFKRLKQYAFGTLLDLAGQTTAAMPARGFEGGCQGAQPVLCVHVTAVAVCKSSHRICEEDKQFPGGGMGERALVSRWLREGALIARIQQGVLLDDVR